MLVDQLLNCLLRILRVGGFCSEDLDTKLPGRWQKGLSVKGRCGIGRIAQPTDSLEVGQDLAHQLQALRCQRFGEDANARHVPGRARKARDESATYGVPYRTEDDRNRVCCALRSNGRRCR